MAAKKKDTMRVFGAAPPHQALNEELGIVSGQLHEKVHPLENANNDLVDLLNCTDLALVVLDAKFRIRRFTAPATKLLNVVGADVGRAIGDITLRFADSDLLKDAQTVLQRSTPCEKEVRTDTGRWYLRRIVPYRTADNQTEGVVITLTDMTTVKQAAEQARYLAAVLMASEDAIMVLDLDGKITAWNRGAELLYGYCRAEALKMNLRQIIPPAERPHFHAVVDQLKNGERIDSWETQRVKKGGTVIDVWATATLLMDESGRPVGIANTDRDITHRKMIQANLQREVQRRTAALQESESRLRAILNAPDDAIITIDRAGIIDSVNPAAERMFGYRAAEMLGQNVSLLMPPRYQSKHDGYLKAFLTTGVAHIIGIGREVEARRKDGSTFHIDLAVSEVKPLKLFTGILRDITRRKELEREVVEIVALEQQRIGQDLHDQCGQELTAMGLFADTLVSSLQERSPSEVDMARKIGQAAKRVLRQVRNIAKGLALTEVEPESLSDALAELVSRLRETSGVHFVFRGAPGVFPGNAAQATHLYHIAQEACTNALKHAAAKNVEIRLEFRQHALVLKIRDDGIGMPADLKEGLGLRIMRNRANVIGAVVSIEAAQPRGTAVICTLAQEHDHGRWQA